MKNLFVFIAAAFGVFVLSLLSGAVFALYKNNIGRTVCFIIAGVAFALFIASVVVGMVSAKNKKTADSGDTVKNETQSGKRKAETDEK